MFKAVLLDGGAYMMCINEVVQEHLSQPVIEKRKAQLADGSIKEYEVVGPIELRFKNRRTNCDAMVLEGDSECLLGANLWKTWTYSYTLYSKNSL